MRGFWVRALFFSLLHMRKWLSSSQWFLRPYFPLIRGMIVFRSCLRFSFWALDGSEVGKWGKGHFSESAFFTWLPRLSVTICMPGRSRLATGRCSEELHLQEITVRVPGPGHGQGHDYCYCHAARDLDLMFETIIRSLVSVDNGKRHRNGNTELDSQLPFQEVPSQEWWKGLEDFKQLYPALWEDPKLGDQRFKSHQDMFVVCLIMTRDIHSLSNGESDKSYQRDYDKLMVMTTRWQEDICGLFNDDKRYQEEIIRFFWWWQWQELPAR